MYNYFVITPEKGGKSLPSFVVRAPLGQTAFSQKAQHLCKDGKWRDRYQPAHTVGGYRVTVERHGRERCRTYKTERGATLGMHAAARRERAINW